MAGIRVEGSTSGNVAEVDALNNLKTTPPTAGNSTGHVGLADRIDEVTGTIVARRLRASKGGALRVSQDLSLLSASFNAAAINSANFRAPATTQTVGQATGFAILNSGNSTAANGNSAVQSYRTFQVFGTNELHLEVVGYRTLAPQSNETTEFGFLFATLPGVAAPSDGVFFRYNTSAELRGVISYNGTETQTTAITPPPINVAHKFEIVCDEREVEFWIDDVLQARILLITAAPGQGSPFLSMAAPFTARYYIGASTPASAAQFRISDVNVWLSDTDASKPWCEQMAGQGLCAYQGQDGGTMGSTALYTNSLAAGTGAALTNTTAAAGSGLGGQFSVQPTLGAGTDGILCSYQNPVASVTQTPRLLYVTGVRIQGLVTTALTGGPVLYAYSLAFGHTAVTMATAESLGSGTKAPRRIALGYETYVVTAAVGALGQGVQLKFDTPITINPGEFIAICAKNLGTVTSAGVICVQVTFDGYFE